MIAYNFTSRRLFFSSVNISNIIKSRICKRELKFIRAKMDLDVIWTDLNRKIPYLRNFFRTEYAPYLNTACTVLLGWLVVSTIFQLIRLIFAHLTTSIIAIILFCPTTMKWLFSDRLGYDMEMIFNDLGDKIKRLLNNFHQQC